ncbi:MAG: F0F1 ATP synthase subunit epsilon [Ilumatobacteraceae bacterium]
MAMLLKILLPYKVFSELDDITAIVAETTAGSLGILPQRLDFAAIIRPGILSYRIGDGDYQYLATAEGTLIKTGRQVYISVKNAIGNAPLGQLRDLVDKEMKAGKEEEAQVKTILAKLESGFIRNIEKMKRPYP